MRQKHLLLFFLTFITIAAKSQSFKGLEFTTAFGANGISPTLGYEKMFGLGHSQKMKIGFGLRYTGFLGNENDLNFRTAPASLTSGKSSIAALFSEDIVSQIDTLQLSKAQTNAVNLNLRFEYSLFRKFSLGFNIDAIGLTFGANKTGRFLANETDNQGDTNNGKTFNAKPTVFNLLLISDSDLGSLNSELFGKIELNEKIGIKAGTSFQFIEYSVEKPIAFNNDRFRSKQLMPFVGITIKL